MEQEHWIQMGPVGLICQVLGSVRLLATDTKFSQGQLVPELLGVIV